MTDAPAPKPGILDIAPYVGGKSRIEGVAEPMKLSSNENALGAGEKAREAYQAALRNIHMYPDGRASKLREAVAAHHGLEPERLIFGNGSDEVFALLNQTYLTAGDNIVGIQEVTGPTPRGTVPPHETSYRHIFSLNVGLDVILEKRRGRRY